MKNRMTNVAITLLLVFLVFGYPMSYYNSQETVTIEVLDKERIGLSSDNYKFLVYTSDEVFENTDSLLYLKYRSSDLQRDLTVGEEFTVTVAGWRVPFLSMHRNIIRIEEQ